MPHLRGVRVLGDELHAPALVGELLEHAAQHYALAQRVGAVHARRAPGTLQHLQRPPGLSAPGRRRGGVLAIPVGLAAPGVSLAAPLVRLLLVLLLLFRCRGGGGSMRLTSGSGRRGSI